MTNKPMRALRVAACLAIAMVTGASCLPGGRGAPPPPSPAPPPPYAYGGYPNATYPYGAYPAYPYYAPYSNIPPLRPPAPPPAAPPPPTPPSLAAPPAAAATPSAAPTIPAGWVNINGFVLPAIAGLTIPPATGGATVAVGTAAPAAPQPGWVNFGGVMVPPIPGLTVPVQGGTAPASTNPAKSCGSAHVGASRFQVDCATPNYARIPSAYQFALPRKTLSPATLPRYVDHRAMGLEGPVRYQGEVGACTGFSFAAAIDNALARETVAREIEIRPAEIVVPTAPPPRQEEVVPAAPSGDYIWIQGSWDWNGAGWAWIPGRFEERRVGWSWVPALYESRGVYVRGHWKPVFVAASVMNLWARYHEPTMDQAAQGSLHRSVTAEQLWPYDQRTACAWDTPCEHEWDDCKAELSVGCTAPDQSRLASAEAKSIATVTNVTSLVSFEAAAYARTGLGSADNMAAIKEALAKGKDVWFGMFIDPETFSLTPPSWWDRPIIGYQKPDVIPDGDFRARGQGHAMLLAGYKVQCPGCPAGGDPSRDQTYYLIHNSWGEDWGDEGYAWISEKALVTNLQAAYTVDVSLSGAPTPQPTSPCQGPPDGGGGLTYKPDAVLGVCLPTCPDGSARVKNVCPNTSQCPQGYVNVTGTCVLAAPATSGTDASGVAYDCTAGACTYMVPTGKGGCTRPFCALSCSAPKYHLTLGAAAMGCAD